MDDIVFIMVVVCIVVLCSVCLVVDANSRCKLVVVGYDDWGIA